MNVPSELMIVLSSTGMGLAGGWATLVLAQVISTPRPPTEHSRYERERRAQMRSASRTYRWFEPLIDELASLAFRDRSSQPGWAGSLRNSPRWSPWTPREFWATQTVEGFLVAMGVFLLVAPTGFVGLAAFAGLGLVFSYPTLVIRGVQQQAARRLKLQRLRLPMVVDQIALMMEAGANFEDSLRALVDEDPQHPLSIELAQVLHEVDSGRTRRDALSDLKDRIADGDVSEVVFAITKGEELGTPLSAILSGQAKQMRLKRSQWGEKAAAEAEVQIVFPGMLVMIACLIVIIAPILLPAAFNIFD